METTIYQTLLWIGVLGVLVLGASSMGAHGGGHHEGGGHGHGGHTHDTVGHHHHAGTHGTHHTHHGIGDSHAGHHPGHHPGDHHHVSDTATNVLGALLAFLSPMTLFAVSLGAGATGLLLEKRFTVPMTAVLALLGGIALLLLVVRPLTQFVYRFASKPAKMLAGTVAQEAIAQCRFDEQGRGIVSVTVDGHLVRLLAHLESDDRAKNVAVATGDRLVVTQIDDAKGSCRVTKL